MLSLEPLPWDSAFFGFRVARIQGPFRPAGALAKALALGWKGDGVRLVYGVCDSSDASSRAEAVECRGFLADAKRTYAIDLAGSSGSRPWPPQVSRASVNPMNLRQLRSLAWQSAEFSRFRIDPAMPVGAWRRMYSIWIQKSLSSDQGEEVWIERSEGRIVGMISITINAGSGRIGLMAVDQDWRRRGIGDRLLTAARLRCRTEGCYSLSVVTQGTNLAACRRYENSGFSLCVAQDIFHFWSQ